MILQPGTSSHRVLNGTLRAVGRDHLYQGFEDSKPSGARYLPSVDLNRGSNLLLLNLLFPSSLLSLCPAMYNCPCAHAPNPFRSSWLVSVLLGLFPEAPSRRNTTHTESSRSQFNSASLVRPVCLHHHVDSRKSDHLPSIPFFFSALFLPVRCRCYGAAGDRLRAGGDERAESVWTSHGGVGACADLCRDDRVPFDARIPLQPGKNNSACTRYAGDVGDGVC